jgi:hypothetical protein
MMGIEVKKKQSKLVVIGLAISMNLGSYSHTAG